MHELRLDGTRRVIIEPAITRVYPSVDRVWHGAEITLFIETRWVPDGTTVQIEVYQADDSEPLLTLETEPTIENNRASVDWKVDLSEDNVDHPVTIHGARHELLFVPRIEAFGRPITGLSVPLYVDLTPFVISF